MKSEIKFGTLHPDGSVTNERVISNATILACPHVILVPEHYHQDGTCKCHDQNDGLMVGWGYTWKDGQWR